MERLESRRYRVALFLFFTFLFSSFFPLLGRFVVIVSADAGVSFRSYRLAPRIASVIFVCSMSMRL
jgi:hypothetical protein